MCVCCVVSLSLSLLCISKQTNKRTDARIESQRESDTSRDLRSLSLSAVSLLSLSLLEASALSEEESETKYLGFYRKEDL